MSHVAKVKIKRLFRRSFEYFYEPHRNQRISPSEIMKIFSTKRNIPLSTTKPFETEIGLKAVSLFRVEMRLLPDYNDYTPRKCGRKHFLFLRASGEEPLIFQIIVENEMKAVYKIQKSVVI